MSNVKSENTEWKANSLMGKIRNSLSGNSSASVPTCCGMDCGVQFSTSVGFSSYCQVLVLIQFCTLSYRSGKLPNGEA
jgi:hypothetical protein